MFCFVFSGELLSYCWKVITTLKTTTYPVTELFFPAITICGSGKHMSLVEKVCILMFTFTTVCNCSTKPQLP